MEIKYGVTGKDRKTLGMAIAEIKGNKINDYHMIVEPYNKKEPIKHKFVGVMYVKRLIVFF